MENNNQSISEVSNLIQTEQFLKVTVVLSAFKDMGADNVQLTTEAIKLINLPDYLDEWYSVVTEAEIIDEIL
jgi:hypothetical protein